MNWQAALEIVVAQTGHERFRWLCSDENPNAAKREACRQYMIRQATGEPEPKSYPSLLTQAGSAVKAAGRFVASGGAMVSTEEQQRRLAICHKCEHFDAARGKCRLCGCVARWKARIATESCPDQPPRW